MTVALAVLAGLLLVALILERRRHDARDERREQAWADERRELNNRIARPEYVAPRTSPVPQPDPPDARAYASIGSLSAVRGDDGD
jgi:hypothetical protein